MASLKHVEMEFDHFSNSCSSVHADLQSIAHSIPFYIENIEASTNMFLASLNDALKLSNDVGKDLRSYVEEKHALESEAKKAQDIMELKECANGVQEALEENDLIRASEFIIKYAEFDKLILDDATIHLFENATISLNEKMNVRCRQLIDAKDVPSLLSLCKILIRLKQKDRAMDFYIQYLRKVIDLDIVSINESVVTSKQDKAKDTKISYADGITHLSTRFRKRLTKQYKTLLEVFEPIGISELLSRMVDILNLFSIQLLDALCREWPEIEYAKRSLDIANVLQYLPLLEQLVHASYSLETQNLFTLSVLSQIENEVAEVEKETFQGLFSKIQKKLKQSKLNHQLHELLDVYISIEEKYMNESVDLVFQESMKLEEPNENMLDEIFYILKESSERALGTYNLNAVCAVSNNLIHVLKIKIQKQLENQFQDRVSRLRRNVSHIGSSLNDMELCCKNILRLSSEIEKSSSQMFSSNIKTVRACLDEFLVVEKSLKTRLKNHLEKIALNILEPVINEVEEMIHVSYYLTESQYSQYQINDPFIENYISRLDQDLAILKESLSQTNLDVVLNLLLRKIALKIEKIIFQKRFNVLGAIQLDKDIRALLSYLTMNSNLNLRDRFTRINQMVYFLNMESLSEVEEAWKDKSTRQSGWSLNLNDIKKLLSLRVDYTKDAIAKLSL